MKVKKIVDDSTNRREFNRAYKEYLERKGKIHCSYCPYHRNENRDNKMYGGFIETEIRYPSWKLVSKNRKQWIKKPIKTIKTNGWWYNNKTYVEIKFST